MDDVSGVGHIVWHSAVAIRVWWLLCLGAGVMSLGTCNDCLHSVDVAGHRVQADMHHIV
jgi:hypothetical protein